MEEEVLVFDNAKAQVSSSTSASPFARRANREAWEPRRDNSEQTPVGHVQGLHIPNIGYLRTHFHNYVMFLPKLIRRGSIRWTSMGAVI